ncbi:MAG: FTR1 family protein [Leptothrix sp. (in: b-proteobacteria)]
MLAAAVIVFRESLEAALFVGIIAAATRTMSRRGRWLGAGVTLGVLGAVLLAALAEQIAGMADGIGQDLLNVGILGVALVMLLWHCIWVSTHGREMAAEARQLGQSVSSGTKPAWALLTVVALSVLREGAETVLFVSGSATGSGMSMADALAGTGLGLLGGVATGALLYAGLSRVPAHRLFAVTNGLIALLAAAIASQLARALAQAGLVDRWSEPLWDSSGLLSDSSTLGTFLHALVGYDAQPSGLQLTCYLGVLATIVLGTRLVTHRARPVVVAAAH